MNQLVQLPAIAIAALGLPAARSFVAGPRWMRTSRGPAPLLSRGHGRAAARAAGSPDVTAPGGVHRLFERHAARAPAALAIRTDDGNWSYGRLNTAANVLARRLRRQGVRPGDAVATVLERSARLVAAALAIVKCGATHVPLDPQAPPAWLAHVLADSGAQAVLADAARLPQLAVGPAVLAVNGAGQPGDGRNLRVEAPAGTPACMLYPAASSGKSLGHGLPHATLARLAARNGYAEFGPADCVAFAGGSPADVAALELWGPLLAGGSVAILSGDMDNDGLAAALFRHDVTVLFIATSRFDACAAAIPATLADLRVLLPVGPRPDMASFHAVLDRQTEVDIRHCYGASAALACALAHRVRRAHDTRQYG